MPERYYLIPMTIPPYSRTNPQRPQFVAEQQTNWTGYPIDSIGMYVCKVNTTDAKHTILTNSTGVRALPPEYSWDTVINSMHVAAQNYIQNQICVTFNITYDVTETLGDLLQRIISTELFDTYGLLNSEAYASLTPSQQNRIINLFNKWGIETLPTGTETLKEISRRTGNVWWDAPRRYVEEF